jgi:flavin-dependent dehydrogenase
MTYDVAVIGGGPAGCAAAIAASRLGATVLLLERGRYPRHKVCGEFISAESHVLLSSLVPNFSLLESAPRIPQARIFAEGRCLHIGLYPAGASLTRFVLDEALWKAAEDAGVDARQNTTIANIQANGRFSMSCSDGDTIWARTAINAAGRNSNLRSIGLASYQIDPAYSGLRDGWNMLSALAGRTEAAARFLGIKGHFHEAGCILSSDLYFFEGGYCGVQPVGDGMVNACALVRQGVAKSLSEVFVLHPELLARSQNWTVATAEVRTFPAIFAAPHPVQDGLLCVGDAGGFIDPFLGDGISLALRTGETAGRIAATSATASEAAVRYEREYEARFCTAFANAARVRKLLTAPRSMRIAAMRLLSAPLVARYVTRVTR